MTAAERARAAYALAELAEDPRDKAAFRAAARAWEQISRPGVPVSFEPMRRDLVQLKRDVAAATGPFQPPRPEESEDSAPEAPADDTFKRYVDATKKLTPIQF